MYRGISKKATSPPDWWLLILLGVLVIIGLVMLSSAGSVIAYQKFGDAYYYVKHQLLSLGLGIILFVGASLIHYSFWRRISLLFLILNIALLILVLLPQVGFGYGGARRWINVFGFLFQPSELAKLSFIVFLAAFLDKRLRHIKDPYMGFIPFVLLLGIMTLLISLEPDIGTLSIIILTGLAIYFFSGAPLKHLLFIGGVGLFIFALLVKVAPYRAARITVFLNPQIDPEGIGYHINQALLAIGSGGLFGVGFGESRQKHAYLPEVTGDSIFAVIAEEMGFIFVVLLIFLYLAIALRGYKIALRAPDDFSKLLAAGISSWFIMQSFVNIGAMLRLVPLTGIPLPLISYGGSALVTLLIAFGILINISRYTLVRGR